MIGIILWIVFGALAGWIASMIMGTNASQGLLMDILLGIAGGLLGGFVMNALGFEGITGFNIYSLAVAIVGAVLVVWIVRLLGGVR
jgi:uncharacterized membrane protein YeaQ/YmgE (transglycosylase-associated protein family)